MAQRRALALSYPEISPLDHKPPIPGCFVTSAIQSYSPEEREPARKTTLDRGLNPCDTMYGEVEWVTNKTVYDAAAIELPAHPPSAPIKYVPLNPLTIKFVKDIGRGRADDGVWKITHKGKVSALKLVCTALQLTAIIKLKLTM
jgi:hypothetical protein